MTDLMSPVGDAAIVIAARSDPREFAALFDRHHEAVRSYVARRAGGSIADDVASETFLVALAELRRYDLSRPDARPWLYGIATNLLRRHRRAEVRFLRAAQRSRENDVDLVDDVLARVGAQHDTRTLSASLAALAARDRDVLLLFAVADLSYGEISVALGIPLGTVRSRLNRCRRQLRSALTPTPVPVPVPVPVAVAVAVAATVREEPCHE
jgi:RNA polymerase sigma factor (sigma-70 family)